MSLKEVLALTHECSCSRCSAGCLYGSGSLTDEDLEQLPKHLELSQGEVKERYLEEVEKFGTKRFRPKLKREDGKPYGKCIFYDEGCTIHAAKPTECKVAMSCKPYGPELITWFNLNYFVDANNPQSIRQWALHLLSGGDTIEGGELTDLVPDKDELKRMFEYSDIMKRNDKDWEKELGLK
jgi:hypothetical protein